MKKKNEQKLSLGKIKIARLSEQSQRAIKGGVTGSVCTICPPQQSNPLVPYAVCKTKVCQVHY